MNLEGTRGRKDEILDQATRLFAERGFAGCSMNDLAEAVGLRKASLFHHFPSKDLLYGAVLERLVMELGSSIAAAVTPGGPWEEMLDRMTDGVVGAFSRHPFAARIVAREMMDWGAFAQARHADLVAPVLVASDAFLKAGMDAGAFRVQDRPQLLLTLIGLHVMPFAIGRMAQHLTGLDVGTAPFVYARRTAARVQIRALVLA